MRLQLLIRIGLVLLFVLPACGHCLGQAVDGGITTDLVLSDICRIRGQETNTLTGLGLVVGLKGTGDGDVGPTSRALAQAMKVMGGQIAVDPKGLPKTSEIKDAKNVAAVFVTATIPAAGAQQGDLINCSVSAISAKSLEGGRLLLTPLLGPRADQPTVYALAQGALHVNDPKLPTNATIEMGCKMEATVSNQFLKGDKFTLVLDPSQSSFSTAQYVEDQINNYHSNASMTASRQDSRPIVEKIARAIDQVQIEVRVPSIYKERPVAFISEVMKIPMDTLQNHKRVFIQERSEVVIIGQDVRIAPVAINHKNLTISSKGSSGTNGGFVGLDSSGPVDQRPKLQNLVNSLKVLDVPTADIIAIIKALKREGNLYGELVIE
jgi:flagellar P-ring protein FlgI